MVLPFSNHFPYANDEGSPSHKKRKQSNTLGSCISVRSGRLYANSTECARAAEWRRHQAEISARFRRASCCRGRALLCAGGFHGGCPSSFVAGGGLRGGGAGARGAAKPCGGRGKARKPPSEIRGRGGGRGLRDSGSLLEPAGRSAAGRRGDLAGAISN